jgi:ABC-2 type transport system permease protein
MRSLGLLIGREFTARIAKKSYWVFTVIGLLVMIGLTFVPTLMNVVNKSSRTQIVLVDSHHLLPARTVQSVNSNPSLYTFRFSEVASNHIERFSSIEMQTFLRLHHVKLAVVVSGNNLAHASFIVEQSGSTGISALQSLNRFLQTQVTQARIASLPANDARLLQLPVAITMHQWKSGIKSVDVMLQSTILVYVMLLLLFVTNLMYGMWVMQGIVEEKSNRIVEMLLIAVRPWHILFGKVFGLGLVALVQYGVWTVGVGVALLIRKTASPLPIHGIPTETIVLFPVFFFLGYLLFGTMFGIAGSLIYRSEEQQMAVMPITFLMIIVFYSAIYAIFNPESMFSIVISFVPFFSPLAMFARLALSDVPWWQIALSIIICCISISYMVKMGARIYRRFALKNSGKSGWKVLLNR